jgi:hypothetical protein
MNRRAIGNDPFEIDTQLSHLDRAPAEHAGMVNVPIYRALGVATANEDAWPALQSSAHHFGGGDP